MALLILCVISLTYYISYQSLCPPWFLPLPRQQDCILEYILPTKPKRAIIIPLLSEKEGFI
ncbi:MAG: hypothetical protein EWV62_11690 [Microcystis aeruginosa Ma_OC_LR_19540900_S633]|nr:MAG: hypothetical protein EWV62_11690 [Microcystis aeruginosa Ma_OC_LR_19540900_S633]